MKLSVFVLFFTAIFAFGQLGMVQSTSGIHVPSAKTNDKGILFISGSYSMNSDGNPLSIGGTINDGQGDSTKISNNTPSNDERLFLSFAPLDNFELGLGVPVHYDGKIEDTELNGFALGDLELIAKWSINAFEYLNFGISGELLFPTGSKTKGFRPRHSWFISYDDKTYPYTAGSMGWGLNFHLSMEINKYIESNAYAGLLKIGDNQENYILWGLGFNIKPIQLLHITLEASGETPVKLDHLYRSVVENPFRLTPALRLNLPNYTYLTLSGDVGLNYFKVTKDKEGRNLKIKSSKKNLFAKIAGTPDVSVSASVSKMFDFNWNDSDMDGVIDRRDLCPNTAPGMVVNSRGCPVDEDQDGVMNIVDLCLGTMRGLAVDVNGCPLDTDKDGVYDYLDQCPDTPEGFAVDEKGCTLDTDKDGVDDNHDKCPQSIPGEPVDEYGCSLDQDHDGVPNNRDQCPNTPEGLSIDEFGCPLDDDKDGVPNDYDKCPNSAPGEKVNSWGCPSDMDNDGVPDVLDSCPDTPEGVAVDEKGCRLDQDKDGVFDEEDQCPNTPEGAPTDETGCPIDSDGDGVPDWADHCMGTLPGVKIDANGCPLNSKQNFNDIAKRIRFKSKDSTFYNSSYTAMNDIVAFMRQHPIAITLQSILDDDSKDSQRYAQMRLKAIENYLIHKGIRQNRIQLLEPVKRSPAITRMGKTGNIIITPILQEQPQ